MSAHPSLRPLCVWMFIAMLPAAARADTVFSNLGPGDSFNGIAWALGQFFGNSVDLGGQFTTGADAYRLDSADMALVHEAGTNVLGVSLWSDAAGVPGSLLTSAAPVSPPADAPPLTTANFGGAFVLSPNTTYWLVADAEGDFDGAWYLNNTADTGLATRLDNGAWTGFAGHSTPAFRISGTLDSAPVVPLPLAGWGGLALLGALGITRAARGAREAAIER